VSKLTDVATAIRVRFTTGSNTTTSRIPAYGRQRRRCFVTSLWTTAVERAQKRTHRKYIYIYISFSRVILNIQINIIYTNAGTYTVRSVPGKITRPHLLVVVIVFFYFHYYYKYYYYYYYYYYYSGRRLLDSLWDLTI
jgi:hypothetical protein